MDGEPAWMVIGYDEVKAVFNDTRFDMRHPQTGLTAHLTNAAIEQNGHLLMHKLLGPLLSARRMDGVRPRIQEFVKQLLDEMERRSKPVDFHQAVSVPLPLLVICELLGLSYQDRNEFVPWVNDAFNPTDRELSNLGLAHLRSFIGRTIAHRARYPAQDLVSDLLASAKNELEPITLEDLEQITTAVLLGGFRTVESSIDKAVLLLLRNPTAWHALQRNRTLVPRAVEEILRLLMPVQMDKTGSLRGNTRYARDEIEIGGVRIHAGELVVLGVGLANLDARVFECPHQFDLTRALIPHLTFGYGAHYCLGASLARLELQTVLEELVSRFPDLCLALPIEQLRLESDLLVPPLLELPVTW